MIGANCSRSLFSCGPNRCISPSLVCNGQDNCGDNDDEEIECTGSTNDKNTTPYMFSGLDFTSFRKY